MAKETSLNMGMAVAVCPQMCDPPYLKGESYGGLLPPTTYTFDEFACLNLTITLPTSLLQSPDENQKYLPIIIARILWSIPLQLANRSSLNPERLGAFGFLISREKIEEGKQRKEQIGNYGIWDVICGFDWVHKFVPGLGGDVENITAFGESAGGVTFSYLIASNGHGRKLFKAILQSGVATAMPLHIVAGERPAFNMLYKTIARSSFFTSPSDKVAKLREIPAEKIVDANLPDTKCRPYVDGVLFPKAWELDDICSKTYDCDWLESILVGDCGFEGSLFRPLYAQVFYKVPNPNYILQEQLLTTFGEETGRNIPNILRAFNLEIYASKPVSKLASGLVYISHFIASKILQVPRASEDHISNYREMGWGKKYDIPAYLYHFDKTNPFPEKGYQGYSHHFVDLLYLFQTLNSRIAQLGNVKTSHERQAFELSAAQNLALKWIEYTYGLEPWDKDKVGVLGNSEDAGQWVVLKDEEDQAKYGRKLDAWKEVGPK
ncbi:Alpha/Beta hydrolase protein [Lipomyces doorenjongii]|uniref:Alpha/Beta hydrolase protein n=1 Tax=Lipomyces doorenjongii TaxID=383834 RepID=UPI0034CF7FCB